MIVNAGYKAGNVAALVWTYNKLLIRVLCKEQAHYAVSFIMSTMTHEVHFTCVFTYDCHVFYMPICFHNKPALSQPTSQFQLLNFNFPFTSLQLCTTQFLNSTLFPETVSHQFKFLWQRMSIKAQQLWARSMPNLTLGYILLGSSVHHIGTLIRKPGHPICKGHLKMGWVWGHY